MQDWMTLARFLYPDGSEMIRFNPARTFHNASVGRANLPRGRFNILMSNGRSSVPAYRLSEARASVGRLVCSVPS